MGVRREHLGQGALLSRVGAKAEEDVQCMVHGEGIHTVGDAELEGGLVGFGLLTT